MVAIVSNQGYPNDNEVLARVDYFITDSPSEGGIIIIGKDSQGREYRPKHESAVRNSYTLPSGMSYSVPIGSNPEKNHSAIYFPFGLRSRIGYPEILNVKDFDDEFFDKFDLTLMDDAMQRIFPLSAEVERVFKKIAIWGALELADLIGNHFWGEMYCERTTALEKFLERLRE